ncbi:MAG: MATE family efflux transporter, partial [Flavobacteriaceae bacterium]
MVLFLLVYIAKPLLFRMGQEPSVVELSFPYLNWVAFSLIPLVIFQAFKQFSDGMALTKYSMYASLLANVVNVIINYFLIFGVWIFPKWGVFYNRKVAWYPSFVSFWRNRFAGSLP